MESTAVERQSLQSDQAMREWDNLADEFRESNRLQANDIVYKLRMISYYLANKVSGRDAIEDFTSPEIESWQSAGTSVSKPSHNNDSGD
jgi:hypothetical protein